MSVARLAARARVGAVAVAAGWLCLPVLARPVPAQTPATAVGLGLPVPALDARAAALGGGGIGLLGGSLALRGPADLTEFTQPVLGVTAAPEGVDVRGAGREDVTGRSRFPLLRGVVPLGEWRVSVGFGGELDQDWSVVFRDTLESGIGRFPFEERREHDGGLGSLDVALARRIGPVSVGGSYARLSGSLRQSFERRFEPEIGSGIVIGNVEETTTWQYTAWRLRGGLGIRLGERARVGGAFTWASDLEAVRDSVGTLRRFSLPTSVEGGASVRLGARWLAAAAGGWTNWSTAAPVRGARVHDAVWAGGGLEYLGVRLGGLEVPLRAGYRYAELPFSPAGRRQLTETAVTLGAGAAVAQGRASFGLALELGSRGDAARTGLEESFRRLSVSFSLSQ